MFMRRIKICFGVFILFLVFSPALFADSPVTSTPFSDAYMDINMVARAKASGVLDTVTAYFLVSRDKPIDQKMAVINALSWDVNGKHNAVLFKEFLAKKYKVKPEKLKLNTLSGDELLCLGYMTIMDDYFTPEKAVPVIEMARKKLKNNFTAEMIAALVKAQTAMAGDWCEVWMPVDIVLKTEKLQRDMRLEAVNIIVNYMQVYESSCK